MRPLPSEIEIFTTADGSPTLAFKRADGYVEKMHHSGGALSESLYIYQQALQLGLEQSPVPHVLSIGLGLGYNELITLAHLLKAGVEDYKLWSFEALPWLREAFQDWAAGHDGESELAGIMARVAAQVSAALQVEAEDLRATAQAALASKKLEVRGGFPEDAAGVAGISVVYYDAYSNKMDPGLWSEDLLTGRLGPLLDERCVLATYAATGSLKRSLKQLGFSLLPKAGFQGKRQSTLAIRKPIR